MMLKLMKPRTIQVDYLKNLNGFKQILYMTSVYFVYFQSLIFLNYELQFTYFLKKQLMTRT